MDPSIVSQWLARVPVRFEEPWWLLGLLTVPISILISARSVAGMARWRRRVALAVRIVVLASAARLILGFVPGLLVVAAVRVLFLLDPLSQKVVLMQAVMPTATMATFFMEYVPLDGELLSAAITFSTIASLFTCPFWYWVIQSLV